MTVTPSPFVVLEPSREWGPLRALPSQRSRRRTRRRLKVTSDKQADAARDAP